MVSRMALFGRKKRTRTEPEEVAPEAATPEPEPVRPRTIAEHREFLLGQVRPLRPFGVGVLEAYGHTLCETIDADLELPTYTSATVAGYGVRLADVTGASASSPVVLPVVDTLDSPLYRGAPLTPRTAVRVSAGAPLPDGVDVVVGLADTDRGADEVAILVEPTLLANLRLAGSDIADGTRLLRSGEVLSVGAIGMLAEAGLDKVLVRPRPRIVVATVGRDLVAPGNPLTSRAQRYDATTLLLAAAARADGAQVYPVGALGEERAPLARVLSDQLIRADLIVLAAELSEDGAVPAVLGELGRFEGVEIAMHPGGRQGFAQIGDDATPVLVVPQGTVAAFVSYHAFVRPLIRRLAGKEQSDSRMVALPARTRLGSDLGVTELIPITLSERGAEVCGDPERELAFDLARADGLAVIDAHVDAIAANQDVECWVFDPSRR